MSISLTQSLPLPRVMGSVLIALIPGIAIYAWFISPLVLFNIVFCSAIACLAEAACLWFRQHTADSLLDGSIILAATLLALAVPPQLAFWQLGLGVIAMVVLGKHLYGGLGQNIFNPAMVGYVFLLLSFPQTMTLWLESSLHDLDMIDLLRAKCSMHPVVQWDAITQATPLESIRAASLYTAGNADPLTQAAIYEEIAESAWPTINISFMLGGIWLLYKRLISWHIPVAVIASLLLLHGVWSIASQDPQVSASIAVFSGATMLGAFFIATDPVTAATSNTGRLIYGTGIGTLTFVIREWGGYPEGFAFAVLFMNMCAPLIDRSLSRQDAG